MKFDAQSVSVTNANGTLLVGFVDNERNPSQYVLLQRAVAIDEQDVRLGMAGLHIEVSDQSMSGYVSNIQAKLRSNHLYLELSRDAAGAIGIDCCIEIGFNVPKDQLLRVKSGLEKVIGPESLDVLL